MVTWRAAMRQARQGQIPATRASRDRLTRRALELLDVIGARPRPVELRPYVETELGKARAEVLSIAPGEGNGNGEKMA